jgi:hypothetical protein
MSDFSLSDKYGIAAAIGLFFAVLSENAVVMLIISIVGLAVGIRVLRAGEARRVAFVAAVAFALVFGFGLFELLR